MDNFYVYEHWRLDRDECFYVGKGKGNRAYGMRHNRNKHHQAVVTKMGRIGSAVEVRIVAAGLSEESAFLLEIERIAFWRAAGVDLTNLTNGGGAINGYTITPEHRAKLSAAKIGKKRSIESIAKGAAKMRGRKCPPDVAAKIAASNKGKKRTAEQIANMSARTREMMTNPDARAHLSEMNKGKKLSENSIQKMREFFKGRTLSEEHKAKIGIANTGKKHAFRPKRPETIAKMKESAARRNQNPEYIAKLSGALLASWQKREHRDNRINGMRRVIQEAKDGLR